MTEGVAVKKTGDDWTHGDLTRQETGEYCGKVKSHTESPRQRPPGGASMAVAGCYAEALFESAAAYRSNFTLFLLQGWDSTATT